MALKIRGPKVQIGAQTKDAKKKLKDLKYQFRRIADGAKDAFVKATAATVALSGAIAGSIRLYHKQIQAEIRMQAAIRAVGKESEISAKAVREMATELQRNSTFGDELALQAAALGISLGGLSQDQLPRFLTLSADFATMMGKDLPAAAQQLSRYLAVPTEGVSRLAQAGVSLTEETKEMIRALQRSGDVVGAQSELFAALESKFQGAAKAATASTGIYQQTGNLIGDFIEKIGASAHNSLLVFTKAIRDLFLAFNKRTDLTEAIAAIVIGAAKVAALVTVLAGLKLGWLAAGYAAKVFFTLIKANPIGFLITSVIALITAFAPLGKVFSFVIDSFYRLRESLETTISDIKVGWFRFASWFIDLIRNKVVGTISTMITAIAGKMVAMIARLSPQLATAMAKMLRPVIDSVNDSLAHSFNNMTGNLAVQLKAASDEANALAARIRKDRAARAAAEYSDEVTAHQKKTDSITEIDSKADAINATRAATKLEAELTAQREATERAHLAHLQRTDTIAYFNALEDENEIQRTEAKNIRNAEQRALRLQELGFEFQQIEQMRAEHLKKNQQQDQQVVGDKRALNSAVMAIEEGGSEATIAVDKATKLATLKTDLVTLPQKAFAETSAAYPAPVGQIFGALHAAVVVASILKGIAGAKRAQYGGLVPGAGGIDSQIARVSPGELIAPPAVAAQLFESARRGNGQEAQPITANITLQLDGEPIARVVEQLQAGTRA